MSAQVTLPDVGVDVADTASSLGELIGDAFMAVLVIAAVLSSASFFWKVMKARASGPVTVEPIHRHESGGDR